MSPRLPAVDPARLAQWCEEQLGSPPAGEIFRSGYLSAVIGLRLADRRAVVVKVRPDWPRMAACVEVQRRLFASGYRCPEPLTGAARFGDGVATAEAYVPGGALLPSAGRSAWAFAGAFARLVTLAPRPAEVPALDPPPSWADWNHAGAGLWPHPEDPEVNLNEVAGPAWIDDTGRRALHDVISCLRVGCRHHPSPGLSDTSPAVPRQCQGYRLAAKSNHRDTPEGAVNILIG